MHILILDNTYLIQPNSILTNIKVFYCHLIYLLLEFDAVVGSLQINKYAVYDKPKNLKSSGCFDSN